MGKIDYLKLVVSIIVCQLAGVVGSLFTVSSVSTWYLEINKPGFNPPSWVFGPVWIVLYFLMGIALYLVWTNKRKSKAALWFFGIQLLLNAFWTIIFFRLHSLAFAFLELILLWAAILGTIYYFHKVSRTAAYLLLPYILWVSFAVVLNGAIWLLN